MKRRVGRGIALARATHGDRSAIAAAVAVAAMGAWSVEGASIGEVVDQGSFEARVAVDHLGASRSVLAPIERAVHGAWQTPETGVPFLAIETVAAVVSVLRQAVSTEGCIIRAVRLGGDTDTCAAIAAGIFAATTGDETISWRDRVPLLADPALLQLARRLARRRQAAMQSR